MVADTSSGGLRRGAVWAVIVFVLVTVATRRTTSPVEIPSADTVPGPHTGTEITWVAAVYQAERTELGGLSQQLSATLSVAVAFIGTFVVATVVLQQLPSEVALAAPLVAFGTASSLVGLYANSVAHSRIVQRLEAYMSRTFRDDTGLSLARGESLGGLNAGGGGFRNAQFTLVGLLTYSSALVVLGLFTWYCLDLADPGTPRRVAAWAYGSWGLLLAVSLASAVTRRRSEWLDVAAEVAVTENNRRRRLVARQSAGPRGRSAGASKVQDGQPDKAHT